MVMISGQKAIRSSRQARFQIVDIVATMRPLTRWRPRSSRRRAFRPWFVMPSGWRSRSGRARPSRTARGYRGRPSRCGHDSAARRRASDCACGGDRRAAAMIIGAKRPLVMLGAAASRPHLAEPLSAFVRRPEFHSSTPRWGRAPSMPAPISTSARPRCRNGIGFTRLSTGPT